MRVNSANLVVLEVEIAVHILGLEVEIAAHPIVEHKDDAGERAYQDEYLEEADCGVNLFESEEGSGDAQTVGIAVATGIAPRGVSHIANPVFIVISELWVSWQCGSHIFDLYMMCSLLGLLRKKSASPCESRRIVLLS